MHCHRYSFRRLGAAEAEWESGRRRQPEGRLPPSEAPLGRAVAEAAGVVDSAAAPAAVVVEPVEPAAAAVVAEGSAAADSKSLKIKYEYDVKLLAAINDNKDSDSVQVMATFL